MIEFKDVSKVYGNGTRGLDHIQLTIGDGEFVSIIGLSGAGKSTLLRSINRLNDYGGRGRRRRHLHHARRQARAPAHSPSDRHDFAELQPGEALTGTEERALRTLRLLLHLQEHLRALYRKRTTRTPRRRSLPSASSTSCTRARMSSPAASSSASPSPVRSCSEPTSSSPTSRWPRSTR